MKLILGCLGLIAVSAVYLLRASCAQTQSFNLAGRWTVEFKFSGDKEHTLRFDALSDGKGAFLLLDTVSSLLPSAEPTKAQWEQVAPDQATFSGAVEFPIGNVGRDAGVLVFKGRFDSADSISGKVSFFRAGQDLKNPATIPAKTGDFIAKRAATVSLAPLRAQQPRKAEVIRLGQEFELRINQEAAIEGEGLAVVFESVVEDSRCPEGVDCVWSGNAKIKIRLSKQKQTSTAIELNTDVESKSSSYLNYEIRLIALKPRPKADKAVQPNEYRAVLIVTKK